MSTSGDRVGSGPSSEPPIQEEKKEHQEEIAAKAEELLDQLSSYAGFPFFLALPPSTICGRPFLRMSLVPLRHSILSRISNNRSISSSVFMRFGETRREFSPSVGKGLRTMPCSRKSRSDT